MGVTSAVDFERRLGADLRWALGESSEFFEGRGEVQETLTRLVAKLDALGVPYAIAGGMALFAHGYRRFTEDVDVLVRAGDVGRIREEMEGLGYVAAFVGARSLRDASSRVRIEFLVTGGFPGDGKPKPVSFPDPESAGVEIGGIRFLGLKELVELKLASGMTAAHRLKDLADVMELIRVLGLSEAFGGELNEYVRGKYGELWRAVCAGESEG